MSVVLLYGDYNSPATAPTAKCFPIARRCFAYGIGGDVGRFMLQHNHPGHQGGGEAEEHADEGAFELKMLLMGFRDIKNTKSVNRAQAIRNSIRNVIYYAISVINVWSSCPPTTRG